jgi:peptidyl-prolyl cis-trans isomerase SurA
MLNKQILNIVLIFFFLLTNVYSDIEIVIKIDDQIITNHDIKKETRYLKMLNPSLQKLDNKEIKKLAKISLSNEIIKKKEIKKNIDFDKKNNTVEEYFKNLFLKLDYDNEINFKESLSIENDYSIEEIKNKIKVEVLWNQLIYLKYKNQIKINEEKISQRINQSSKTKQKEYLLSEILFQKEKNVALNKTIEKINNSIMKIGFSNTANIFSVSDTSKFGGKIGWIKENIMPQNILQNIKTLNKGEYSDVIKIGNNFLIIKVEDIKDIEIKLDPDKDLKKFINIETNRQLNQFSRIYFNKAKINYSVNEY